MPMLVAEVTFRVAAAALVFLAGCPIPDRMDPAVESLSKPPPPPARGLKQASIYGGTSNVSYGVLVAVEAGQPVCKADATKTVPLGELKVKLEFAESTFPDPIVSADFDLPQAAPTSMDENAPTRRVQFPPDKETRMTWQFTRQQGSLVRLSCSLTPMKPSALLVPENGNTEGFLPNEQVPRGVYRLRYQHHEECKLFTATRSDGASLPEKITLGNNGLSVKVNCDGGQDTLSWTVEKEAPRIVEKKAPGCPPHKTECGGVCTNLHSDAANCGACGNACTSNQVCRQGACVPRSFGSTGRNVTYDAASVSRSFHTDSNGCHGKTSCGGVCANLQTDGANCGSCGRACSPGQVCEHGACAARVYDINKVHCANDDDLSAAKNKQVGSVMIEDSLVRQTLTYRKATIVKLPPTKMKCDLSVNGTAMSVSRACMNLAVPANATIVYEGCR